MWRHPENCYQQILGNWQANGITTFMSGTPFTVYDSQDVSLQGARPRSRASPATGRIWLAIQTLGRARRGMVQRERVPAT
jgi:hypothetical protein